MKEIITDNFKKADQKTSPPVYQYSPVFRSHTDSPEDIKDEFRKKKEKKKTKKLPQLGMEVEDVSIRELVD